MPKVFESEVIYDYRPLHTLNWLHRKYPNPFATHVQTVDTLSRSVDTATGMIRSERLIGVQQGAPKWVAKLLSLPPTAYVREIIFIDPSAPSATCMSVNLDLKQYVSCLELIRYLPSSTEPFSKTKPGDIGPGASSPSTLFTQRAMITSGFSSSMIAKRLEKASVDRFAGNAGVGRKGFEWVLAGGSEGSCG